MYPHRKPDVLVQASDPRTRVLEISRTSWSTNVSYLMSSKF